MYTLTRLNRKLCLLWVLLLGVSLSCGAVAAPAEGVSVAQATKAAQPKKPAVPASGTAKASPAAAQTAPAAPAAEPQQDGQPFYDPQAQAEPEEDAEGGIMGLVNQYGLYAGIALVVILVLLALKMAGGKKDKALCQQCGKKVIPGMAYCSDCNSTRNMMLDMEQMAPQVRSAQTPTVTPHTTAVAAEPKKKVRPSGRVIATVTMRKGENPGYKFSFYDSQVQMSIGRDPECDMVIEEDEEVSPKHAVISMADGGIFTIHDMSAAAGLFVNGNRIKQFSLKSGDVIRLGKTELTFARL